MTNIAVLIFILLRCINGDSYQVKQTRLSANKLTAKIKLPASMAVETDLWVVGAGTLGLEVIKQWSEVTPNVFGKIVAETRSIKENFKNFINVVNALREDRKDCHDFTARNVLICLPPSSSSDYLDEVKRATRLWAGLEGGGSLVFTSSTGVYGDAFDRIVTEQSPVDTESKRSKLLLDAETCVLARGGSVVRFAGLYDTNRGPHIYWLRMAAQGLPVESCGDSLVNLVHYSDAASMATKILKSGLRSRVFIAVDDEPIKKRDICAAAFASQYYPSAVMPQFTGIKETRRGKLCDSTISRSVLDWQPRHRTFRQFMEKLNDRQC